MAVRASAPASAMALAIGRMSDDVRRELDQERQVRGAADGGGDLAGGPASIANWSPPRPTFGHEMFSSMPATPGTPSSRLATST